MQKYPSGATGAVVLTIAIVISPWVTPGGRIGNAQDGVRPSGPLISRGYIDAPAGTVVLGADMEVGGSVLTELRVVDGQKVKRGDVIAFLSGYTKADVRVRTTEAALEKDRRGREAMVAGYRRAEIASRKWWSRARLRSSSSRPWKWRAGARRPR